MENDAQEQHISNLLGEEGQPDTAETGTGETDTGAEQAATDAKPETASEAGQEKQAEEQASQETDEGKPPKGYVPYGALHEERSMRQNLQSQVNELNQKLGQFTGLREELQSIRESQNQKTQQQLEQEENELMETDPIEALRRRTERLEKVANDAIQQQDNTKQQQQQQHQAAEQLMQLTNTIRHHAQEFTQHQPDYPDAFKFMIENRISELEALGYNQPEEIQRVLDMETLALAQSSMQRGLNPAQAAYNLAVAKGYTKSEKPTDDGKGGEENSLDKQLDRLEAGQKAARTLSHGGGTGKPGEEGLSLAEIENMSDAEFDKLWNDMESSAGGGGF